MSEHILKASLADLTTVRLVCPHEDCQGVAEFKLDLVKNLAVGEHCPFCQRSFSLLHAGAGGQPITPVAELAKAIQALRAAKCGIEFPIGIDR